MIQSNVWSAGNARKHSISSGKSCDMENIKLLEYLIAQFLKCEEYALVKIS